MNNLIIHVPHSSISIPEEYRDQFTLTNDQLLKEACISADLHTDIIAKTAWPGATIIAAEFSRLLVDVERYADDDLEAMASVGRGMIYTHTHDGIDMRRPLKNNERKVLHENFYIPHWKKMEFFAKNSCLIDLHSYPVEPWPVELSKESYRPEIDLGISDHKTPEKWAKALKIYFEGCGYTIGFNTPYSGVIDAGARFAVMIELRRDIIGTPFSSKLWSRLIDALSNMPLCNDEYI